MIGIKKMSRRFPEGTMKIKATFRGITVVVELCGECDHHDIDFNGHYKVQVMMCEGGIELTGEGVDGNGEVVCVMPQELHWFEIV